MDSSLSYYASSTNITLKPSTLNTYAYTLKAFDFGIIDQTNGTQSVESLLNSDETVYGSDANSTAFNLGYKGLGLPTNSYTKFTNLMSIITNGDAECLQFESGYCILPGTCASYPELWAYRFKIEFQSSNLGKQHLLLPLSTFAEDQDSANSVYGQHVSAQQICNVNVQMLDNAHNNSKAIIFGAMFYQNVFMNSTSTQTSPSSYSTTTTLAINVNAMQNSDNGPATGAYITSQVFVNSETNAFAIVEKEAVIDMGASNNGLPAFQTTITGLASNSSMLGDFSNEHTVVFTTDCVQYVTGTPGSCSGYPTLVQNNFDATGMTAYKSFTDLTVGGYTMNGDVYNVEVCQGSSCRFQDVYAASVIFADDWLYNQESGAGILGYGPNSANWDQYIDPVSGVATYSIALARVGFASEEPSAAPANAQSNITFGGTGDMSYYSGMPNLQIATLGSDDFKYALDSMGFGRFYYNSSGEPESQYFYNFSNVYPAKFSVNYAGLGLPQDNFYEYSQLLQNLTNNSASCSFTQGGVCVLPNACETYGFLSAFSFNMHFSSTRGNYINVPLGAFAESTSFGNCSLRVNYLFSQSQHETLLGGAFFQEFYGIFENYYDSSNTFANEQSATFYVQEQSIWNASYIGDAMLPLGTDPFYTPPTPPTPPSPNNKDVSYIWIIVLCVIIVVLLGFLGWAVHKYRTVQKENDEKRGIIYAQDEEAAKTALTNSEEI